MTYDLRQGLTALGDAERAAAPALPVGTLLTRAHHKRMAHAATYSAIGVGAAAAVTIGAIAANGTLTDRDPVPPATGAPTSTPTQTPRATPTPTPTTTPTEVAWAPNWDLCGTPAEDFWARDTGWVEGTSQELYLSSDLLPESALPMGEPLTLQMRVLSWGLPQRDADVRIADVVALDGDPFTGEGQVVAVAAVPTDIVTHGTLADGDGMPLDPAQVTLTACTASPLTGGDGALDAALPHGSYQAGAVAEVTTTDGIEVLVGWLGYLGEPPEVEGPATPQLPVSTGLAPTEQSAAITLGSPLRLGPSATWNNTNVPADEQALWCGTPAPTGPLRNDAIPALTLSGTGFRDGDDLVVQLTLTNTWSNPVPSGQLIYPYLSVAKDGRVVGNAQVNMSSYSLPAPLQPGEAVQLEMSLGPLTCTFMLGEPWPAGTYELNAGVFLYVPPDVTPGIPGYAVRTTFTLD